MRRNKLRELLKAGQPTLGTRIHSTWPSVIEAIGHTGVYDYIEFVAEYAPYTLHDLDNMGRAADLMDISIIIKLDYEERTFVAQRAIGSGFHGVLFADCRSPEDAQDFVRAVRPDTPEDGGVYGSATRRFTYMGYGGGADYVQALRDVLVILMIEKKQAVERLDEILAVPGIDMVQWGPSDYSMSTGHAGERGNPDVRAAEKKVFETCMRLGIPARAEINTPDDAKRFLDMGVRHFNLGVDLSILYQTLKSRGEGMRELLK
ncbi:MAG TPA: aldolase/citrate lyase family protein [Chloroflexota bacterium]|nr:aldolase/citrate lyase family protein [Chloroflexota bacterium]